MEPEFDKVIDALLRSSPKVGGDGGASPVHLDAADIAAFAENALPAATKAEFTTHFADCGRCRGVLANVIAMNAEAAPKAAVAAAAASAPVRSAETAEPWYRRLFRAPNLAFAMGALVLVFGGLIGYTVLQNSTGETSIAQVEDSAPAASGPMAPEESFFSANTAANTANAATNSNAMTRAANTAVMAPTPDTSGGGGGGRLNTAERAEGYSIDGERDAARSQPTAAAPPPPIAMSEPAKDDRADVAAKAAEKPAIAEEQKREVQAQTQAMPPVANSGPVQSPAGRSTSDAALAKKRSTVPGAAPIPVREVGGKTFERREGVWYDRDYSGQRTTNVRRGTDDYRKLDGGLRTIAEGFSGTVVIVWKTKAYRIQ